MQWLAISFSVGVMLAACLPRLVPVISLLAPTAAAAACFCMSLILFRRISWARHWCLLILMLLLGFTYANHQNSVSVANQLADSYDRQDVWLNGHIVDISHDNPHRQRFLFKLSDSKFTGLATNNELLLSWYEHKNSIAVGERWRLKVRLKSPRGFVNPAGFDYQVWLLRKGIVASGTVKSAIKIGNRSEQFSIPLVRQSLRLWLERAEINNTAHFKALTIGDKSHIDSASWRLLQGTGTVHLMAISGLHIGLIALLGYFLGAIAGRLANAIDPRISTILIANISAAALAVAYAALAGFSTPTLRALIMVLTVQLCLWLYRPALKPLAASLALLGVVVIDPLAIWDTGFWLSFAAAITLLLMFSGRKSNLNKTYGTVLAAVRSQWYLFVVLLVPMLWLLQRVSLLAPIANLIAIPVVSVLVVPLLLLAVLLQSVLPLSLSAYSYYPLWLADWVLSWLWQGLEWLQGLPLAAHINGGAQSWGLVVVGLLAVALMLSPRGIPGRHLGYLLLVLPLIFSPRGFDEQLRITFMDVGQGTAVVIEAGGKRAVYDTGRSFSQKFDAGSGIVSPYLDSIGARTIDKLIISHGDADHSGGAAQLAQRHAVIEVNGPAELISCLSSGSRHCLPASWNKKPLLMPIKARRYQNCESLSRWQWGQTHFSLFSFRSTFAKRGGRSNHPQANARNNRSCLLLIEHNGISVLLTGDIEALAERGLLSSGMLPHNIDWMTAPHHGSKTSSTKKFLAQLRPRNVVFQYGHKNSYRHPNKAVVERYISLGSRILSTDQLGAIQLSVNESGDQVVTRMRQDRRRFWYH